VVNRRTIESTSPATKVTYRVGAASDGKVRHRIFVLASLPANYPEVSAASGWVSAAPDRNELIYWTPHQAATATRSSQAVAKDLAVTIRRLESAHPSWPRTPASLADIGMGLLALYAPSARERELCLKLSRSTTIGDVRAWLSDESYFSHLDAAFNTRRRVAIIRAAELQATTSAESWRKSNRNPHYQWLVAKGITRAKWTDSFLDQKTPNLKPGEGELFWRNRFILSIELLMFVSKLSAAQRAVLVTAAGKAALAHAGERTSPWEADFPDEVAALPIGVLYVAEPNHKVLRLALRLADAGGTNLGHVAALNQTLWSAVRRSHHTEWIRLRRKLQAP
jgi:hypothetical protein